MILDKVKAIDFAKDVIKQLHAKKYISTRGSYARLPLNQFNGSHFNGKEFQNFLLKKEVKCDVCALGSLFTSKILKDNSVTYEQFCSFRPISYDNKGLEFLTPYFSKQELLLLEFTFELGNDGILSQKQEGKFGAYNFVKETYYYDTSFDEYNYPVSLLNKAIDYGLKWRHSREIRLKYLMLNIIRNKGYFKIPERI